MGCVYAMNATMVAMGVDEPTVEDMTWWAYVQSVSGGVPNRHIAQAIGVTPSSVGRWSTPGSGPGPDQAAAFARTYGRPVLEAFIAAGFLTPEEAGEKPSAPPSLASLDDEDLLEEVRRRMAGGSSEDRQSDAEKTAHRTGDPVTPNVDQEHLRRAARRGVSKGRVLRARLEESGEESQDG